MVVIFNSKTGFTKKYAEMIATQAGLSLYSTNELSRVPEREPVLFLGWISAGKIQGLKKVITRFDIKAVCACGTGRKAEPDDKTLAKNNNIIGTPFFYLRGGCLPLGQLKGPDKIAMSVFVKILKSQKVQSEAIAESIENIEKGCNYVCEERIAPVIDWIKRSAR